MISLKEQNELVQNLRTYYLRARINAVNLIIFLGNAVVLIFLILRGYDPYQIISIVVPTFILNIVILYTNTISEGSLQHIYLGMYVSILGIISVANNIFLIELTPNTYILIYLAIFVIGLYRDKRAVTLGYIVTLIYASINHFKYQDSLIGYNNNLLELVPYVYEAVLVILIIFEFVITWINDNEMKKIYEELEYSKRLELTYQNEIIKNIRNSEHYNTNVIYNNLDKVKLYTQFFEDKFLINNLDRKIDIFIKLQEKSNQAKIISKMKSNYRFRKEIKQLEYISMINNSHLKSLIMNLKARVMNRDVYKKIDYEYILGSSELTFENKVLGFIILYEALLYSNKYLIPLTHEEIVNLLCEDRTRQLVDKDIINFFLKNEAIFKKIHSGEINNIDEIKEFIEKNNKDNCK